MSCFTEEQTNKISNLVKEIEKLSDIEKLILYLQLPSGRVDQIEGKFNRANGKQNQDILTKKPDQETTQTYTWILSHLEEDPNVSLPKQEVYDEYRSFCQANRFEPLCVADFGKAMKHAFPCIKPRRLGQRGNSRYCYSGLKKKYKIHPPTLPDISELSEPSATGANNNSHHHNNHHNHHQQQQNYGTVFGQSPSTSTRPDINKTATNKSSPLPLSDIHQMDDHHHHQQQHVNHGAQQTAGQQHLDHRHHYMQPAGYEAMNLKIEHSNQHQHHHNHHHEHNHQASSVLIHQSTRPSNGELYLCDQLQHHLANGHKINGHEEGVRAMPATGQMSSSSMSTGSDGGSSQAASIIDGPQQVAPNCDDFGHQPGPVHRHDPGQVPYDYHGAIIQRFGTPDDDDYRHHYQDLNRPIVSEVIPFSQTGQYQRPVGFIYSQPTNPVPPAQQHQQQQQTLLANNQANAHPAKQQHQLAPQHQAPPVLSLNLGHQINPADQCSPDDQCSAPTIQHHHHSNNNINDDLVSSTNESHNNTAPNNNNTNQINTADAAATTTRGDRNDCVTHPNHQYQQPIVDNEHQINHQPSSHNLQLNINNNHLNNQSVDCCPSPWASPASTPYPGMANLMMYDVHEYCAGECLRYDQ